MNKIQIENTDFLNISPFKVGENYFENSENEILNRINETQFDWNSIDISKNPFLINENYFDELSSQIKLKTEKWKKIDEIDKIKIFNSSESYFDSLALEIKSKIEKKNRSKTPIFIFKPQWALSLAAACCGIFFIWFGLGFYQSDSCRDQLCLVTKQEISDYLKENTEHIQIENLPQHLIQNTKNYNISSEDIDINGLEYDI